MIESLECLPCLSRQAAVTARLSTDDSEKQQAGVGEALMHLAMMDRSTPPSMAAEDLQRTLSRHTGRADPFVEVRQRLTVAARALLPALLGMKFNSDDPWTFSLRVSAAGNLLEAARDPGLAGAAMDAAWQATGRGELAVDHGEVLRALTKRAGNILFLADNAGEVVWDQLLIESLGPARVVLVVRAQPFLQDALSGDLDFALWPVKPRVATYDTPLPGHPAGKGGRSIDELLASADLVVAKGSEWPVRLEGRVAPGKCFHVLAPSCERIASRFGVAVGSLVAAHARSVKILAQTKPTAS